MRVCRAGASRVCCNLVTRPPLSYPVRKVPDVWLLGSECVVCATPARGVCGPCTSLLAAPTVPPLLAIESAAVLCSYEGVGAELIRAVKYRNRRQAISPMIDALLPSLPFAVDAVVAVPSNPARVRERGYDLTATLARRIAAKIDAPVIAPLERVTVESQLGRGRQARQQVEFRATGRVPERVLLVDDVVTTGATAMACAITLGLAGARSTSFVALASTPISPDNLVATL